MKTAAAFLILIYPAAPAPSGYIPDAAPRALSVPTESARNPACASRYGEYEAPHRQESGRRTTEYPDPASGDPSGSRGPGWPPAPAHGVDRAAHGAAG